MDSKLKKNAARSPLLLPLAILILMVSPAGWAAIVNGGFESVFDTTESIAKSSLDNWTITQTVGSNEVFGRDTTVLYALAPYAGSIAAAYHSSTPATGNGATLTQAILTDITKTYNLSLWVANPIQDPGNTNNIFSVSWDGALISLAGPFVTEIGTTKTYVVTPQTNWFQIVATDLPVSTTSTNLAISGRNNDWATLVDAVIVEETPEPSTVVMLGIGTAIMGLRRRRQRNR